MEGVGARLGRSSTRYGPTTVFTGPVRKWKKKWVHVSPSNKKDNNSTASVTATTVVNGGSGTDGSNGSHLLLFKWAPLGSNSNGNGNGNGNDDGKSESNSPIDEPVVAETTVAEDPPRRRFKYVPIAVLEEQKKEVTEIEEDDKVEEENKIDGDTGAAELSEKKMEDEEKPDMNDVPMEDNQEEEEKIVRQDLNESTLDIGLNLNANDVDSENNSKADDPVEE